MSGGCQFTTSSIRRFRLEPQVQPYSRTLRIVTHQGPRANSLTRPSELFAEPSECFFDIRRGKLPFSTSFAPNQGIESQYPPYRSRQTDKRELVISRVLAGFHKNGPSGGVECALSDLNQPVDLPEFVHELFLDVVHPLGIGTVERTSGPEPCTTVIGVIPDFEGTTFIAVQETRALGPVASCFSHVCVQRDGPGGFPHPGPSCRDRDRERG